MGVVAAFGRELSRTVTDWEKKSDEIDSLIIKHTCIGGASGLLPIPVVDSIIMLGNQMLLYRNINSVLGVSIKKDTLKVLGMFMLSQATGMVAAFGLILAGTALGNLLKASLFGMPVGMAINAAINAGVTYVLGVVYAKALVAVVGNGKQFSEENMKDALRKEFEDKDELKRLYNEGRDRVKGTDFSAYRKDAEDAKKFAED